MSDTNDAATKTEEPTSRKLDRAREQGDVVKTQDLSALSSLAAGAAVLALSGGMIARNLGSALLPFLASAGTINVQGTGALDVFRTAMMAAAPAIGAVIAAVAAASVFANLIQNALQATPPDGRVEVEVAASEAGARVTVRNTGSGIPLDIRERIFQPFFTTKATGTGLGLAIARQIVDAHRGRIEVVSDGVSETTFVVELPARAPAVLTPEAPAARTPEAPAASTQKAPAASTQKAPAASTQKRKDV